MTKLERRDFLKALCASAVAAAVPLPTGLERFQGGNVSMIMVDNVALSAKQARWMFSMWVRRNPDGTVDFVDAVGLDADKGDKLFYDGVEWEAV